MSIADKITSLTTARNNIRTALVNKGVAGASSAGFGSFATMIDSISTSSGENPTGSVTLNLAGSLPAYYTGTIYIYKYGTSSAYSNTPFSSVKLDSTHTTATLPAGSYAYVVEPSQYLNGYKINGTVCTSQYFSYSNLPGGGNGDINGYVHSTTATQFTLSAGGSYSISLNIAENLYTLASNTYTMAGFEGASASKINGAYTKTSSTKNGYPVFYCSANSQYMFYYDGGGYDPSYWVIASSTSVSPWSGTCYWSGTYSSDHYEPTCSSASNFSNMNADISGSNRRCIAGTLGTISLSASSTSVSGTQNTAISNITLTGTASNGKTVSFSATGLPAGVSINGSTISGTPTGSGSSTATITASATDCENATLTITFTIAAASGGSSSTPTKITISGATEDTSFNGDYVWDATTQKYWKGTAGANNSKALYMNGGYPVVGTYYSYDDYVSNTYTTSNSYSSITDVLGTHIWDDGILSDTLTLTDASSGSGSGSGSSSSGSTQSGPYLEVSGCSTSAANGKYYLYSGEKDAYDSVWKHESQNYYISSNNENYGYLSVWIRTSSTRSGNTVARVLYYENGYNSQFNATSTPYYGFSGGYTENFSGITTTYHAESSSGSGSGSSQSGPYLEVSGCSTSAVNGKYYLYSGTANDSDSVWKHSTQEYYISSNDLGGYLSVWIRASSSRTSTGLYRVKYNGNYWDYEFNATGSSSAAGFNGGYTDNLTGITTTYHAS